VNIMVADPPLTLASEPASRRQRALAGVTTGCMLAATLMLLPFASQPGPAFPGFLMLNQMALFMAYALGAWVLYVQFHRGRSLSLLLSAAASLFTAGAMVLQLASFPGVFGPGSTRLLGNGPETTTWLWTFWHAGPPALGLAYASTVRRERAASFRRENASLAVGVSLAVTLLLIAAFGAISTVLLPWLPQQTDGDNYYAFVRSGVGPGLLLFTLVALAALWRKTRANRTVLELWLTVSLALLALDSLLTQVGGMRGSVGWYAGRVGALISALAVLWAYLHEVNATYARAELAAATERLQAETNLRQSQKMEAIGHLTSGIAHDFNNLLMVMSSAFDLITKHPDDPAKIVKVTEAGLRSISKGRSLTARLLLFSRRTMLSPERVNPNAVLRDFEPMLAHAVPPSIRVEWQLDPGLRYVMLDTVEFETAVLNIVVNACDALKGVEGRLVVATRTAVLSPGAVTAGCRADDPMLDAAEYAVVSVADNGPGMPKAVAAHAFDPFFTTKEPGKGTGLGLSQVYGFAQSANGLAKILTGPTGTTIELWLPYATRQVAVAEVEQGLALGNALNKSDEEWMPAPLR
jgi:signal transduction histidine kinase